MISQSPILQLNPSFSVYNYLVPFGIIKNKKDTDAPKGTSHRNETDRKSRRN